jgi:hypothetical protein
MREREEMTMMMSVLKNGNLLCLPAAGMEERMDEELY